MSCKARESKTGTIAADLAKRGRDWTIQILCRGLLPLNVEAGIAPGGSWPGVDPGSVIESDPAIPGARLL